MLGGTADTVYYGEDGSAYGGFQVEYDGSGGGDGGSGRKRRSRGGSGRRRGRRGDAGEERGGGDYYCGDGGGHGHDGPKALGRALRAACGADKNYHSAFDVRHVMETAYHLVAATRGVEPAGDTAREFLTALLRRGHVGEATDVLRRQAAALGLPAAVAGVAGATGFAVTDDGALNWWDASDADAEDAAAGAAVPPEERPLAGVLPAGHFAGLPVRESARDRPLPCAGLAAVLCALPQCAGIAPQAAAALVDAAAPLLRVTPDGYDPARAPSAVSPQECRTYVHRRFRWSVLEMLDEARTSLAAAMAGRGAPGRCVYGACLLAGQKPGEVIVEGGDRGGGGEHGIRGLMAGDVVAVRRIDDGPHEDFVDVEIIEAEVRLSSPLVVEPIRGKGDAALLTGAAPGQAVWRIDKLANRVQFERGLHGVRVIALAAAAPRGNAAAPRRARGGGGRGGRRRESARGPTVPAGEIARAIVAADLDRDGKARVAAGVPPRALHLAAAPVGALRAGGPRGKIRLNPSQDDAYRQARNRRLTLIQGPPGTGKTAVSVELLKAWATQDNGDGGPTVLACSDSNIAVDNLLAGLIKAGVKAVRVGRPETTSPELLEYSVDAVGAEAAALARTNSKDVAHAARQRAIKGATVLCATCVGAGSGILERCTFTHVLVDEAAQATELATVVALARGCQQLALVGDHCQLPPTVTSDLAYADGLGDSLFDRLVAADVPACLLRVQYRMHPSIAAFPSACFYAGRIEDGIQPSARAPVPGFRWPRPDFPIAFVPSVGPNAHESADGGTSKSNAQEVNEVTDILHSVLRGKGSIPGEPLSPEEIGVVTPYAAQVRLLRQARPDPAIEVASVDGFQGREKELIIISTVRSNAYGNVGFVADWRRANVALTRARRGCIIVGNPETLEHDDKAWGPLLTFLRANGCVLDGPATEYTEVRKAEEEVRALARRICGVPDPEPMSAAVLPSELPEWEEGSTSTTCEKRRQDDSRSRSHSRSRSRSRSNSSSSNRSFGPSRRRRREYSRSRSRSVDGAWEGNDHCEGLERSRDRGY